MIFIVTGILIVVISAAAFWLAVNEVRPHDVTVDPDGTRHEFPRRVTQEDWNRAYLFGVVTICIAALGGAIACKGIFS